MPPRFIGPIFFEMLFLQTRGKEEQRENEGGAESQLVFHSRGHKIAAVIPDLPPWRLPTGPSDLAALRSPPAPRRNFGCARGRVVCAAGASLATLPLLAMKTAGSRCVDDTSLPPPTSGTALVTALRGRWVGWVYKR